MSDYSTYKKTEHQSMVVRQPQIRDIIIVNALVIGSYNPTPGEYDGILLIINKFAAIIIFYYLTNYMSKYLRSILLTRLMSCSSQKEKPMLQITSHCHSSSHYPVSPKTS